MSYQNAITANTQYGTGRIGEIIDSIEKRYGTPIDVISADSLLLELCNSMQITPNVLDQVIAGNSPVLRTVKGHCFETYFDLLLKEFKIQTEVVGGDHEVDRVVNGHSLQLKTPTESGTRGTVVQYKTHKTHGAKSESESLDYYSSEDGFADFLVGLVSYEPLRILFLPKHEIPRHPVSPRHLRSPFSIETAGNRRLNAFDLIGLEFHLDPAYKGPRSGAELLPVAADAIGVSSEVIIRTILSRPNFRIWDMSVRGFLRERVFQDALDGSGIEHVPPTSTGRPRADKADIALARQGADPLFAQMKGISTNNCQFDIADPVIATETQLTRGRVNDHPTQSRLYLVSDFDFLILAIDPPVSQICSMASSGDSVLKWEFYAIPVSGLKTHSAMPHRLASLQKFKYSTLQSYRIDDWATHFG